MFLVLIKTNPNDRALIIWILAMTSVVIQCLEAIMINMQH